MMPPGARDVSPDVIKEATSVQHLGLGSKEPSIESSNKAQRVNQSIGSLQTGKKQENNDLLEDITL